ncbi:MULTISPECIES: hypothetical protein [unclassified Martelella]|uniref:hypothetical protein n=1 Tax=unclassified Martelella TaxID=2629616 RepID=UPI0025C3D10F|nr:hypothetical protein [Martelella sp.]
MVFFVTRYGVFSFPVFFVSQVILYLVAMPLALNGFDEVTGARADMTWKFPVAVTLYSVFYLLGVRLSAPLAFERNFYLKVKAREPQLKRAGSRVATVALGFIAAGMIAYSIASRNIFTSGDLLFTIIGFDLALVLYLIGHNRRPAWLNAIFFICLLLLYIYSGFRYRILILFLAEVIPFALGRSRIFSRIAIISGTILLAVILGAFAQIRSYGSFSVVDLLNTDLDIRTALLASGEQTVSISTIAIIENNDYLPKIGFEPIVLVATQFIPSAIFPDKPRASYLGFYNRVTKGLRSTGTAMHDVGQATLMFGIGGLPFSSFLFGYIIGFFLNSMLKRSESLQYMVAALVLFGISIPTRGYFAQQITWALTFLMPVVLIHFSGRLVFGGRRGKTYIIRE